jgi:hypothetical protein
VYQTRTWQFNSETALKFKDSGLKALVVQMLSSTYYPGFGEIVLNPPMHPDVPFPVFEITIQQSRELTGWFMNQTARGLIVSFDEEESNPWQPYLSTIWPIGGWILLISSGLILLLAGYKLTLMIIENGVQLSIGQCVLALISLAMLIRLVWCMVDPFGAYRVAPFAWNMLGATLPFAIIIGTTLLIALYWHEMIKITGRQIFIFLDKLLIPFLIFIALLFIFEFVTALLRGLRYYSFSLLIATSVIYASISGIVLVIFLVEKIRISYVFRSVSKRLQAKKKKKFDRAFFLVLAISIVMVLWLPPIIFIAAASWFWHPAGYTIAWFIILFGINIIAFLQTLLIRAPKRTLKWFFCGLCHKHPAHLLPTPSTSIKLISYYSSSPSVDLASVASASTSSEPEKPIS